MLATLINRDCSIIRRSPSGSEDAFGNEIQTETSVATVCDLQQQRADERNAQGETSYDEWIAFLLAGISIKTADTLVVDGQEFEVIGDPWHARNPRTKSESHIEVRLRRTAGDEDAS